MSSSSSYFSSLLVLAQSGLASFLAECFESGQSYFWDSISSFFLRLAAVSLATFYFGGEGSANCYSS